MVKRSTLVIADTNNTRTKHLKKNTSTLIIEMISVVNCITKDTEKPK